MGNQIITKQNFLADEHSQNPIDKYFEKIIKYTDSIQQNNCVYNDANCCYENLPIESLDNVFKKFSKKQREKIISYNDNQLSEKKINKYYIKKIELIIKLKHLIYVVINNNFSNYNFKINNNKSIKYLNELTEIYNLLVKESTINKSGTNKKNLIIKEKPISLNNLNRCCIKVNNIMHNLHID